MIQDELRSELIDYLKKTDIKSKRIAKDIDLEISVFSRFKNGSRDLFPEHALRLKKYLDEKIARL